MMRAAATYLIAGAAAAPLVGLAAHAWGGRDAAESAALGAAIASLSAVTGLWLLSWALRQAQSIFLTALVGGILGRMVLFGGAVTVLVAATERPPAAFVGGLFAYYFLYQFLEIRVMRRFADGGEAVTGS